MVLSMNHKSKQIESEGETGDKCEKLKTKRITIRSNTMKWK